MKKFLLIISVIFLFQTLAFADEIIDSKGNIIPCKIITICDGLIEYQKDGLLNTFYREMNQAIFNDFVDVVDNLKKRKITTRYSGIILFKDPSGIRLQVQNGETMQIPWYKVKFVGVYNPN